MVEWKNVTVGYDQKTVLEHINLKAKPGRVLVLVGRNGCGKSTLLKTLLNLSYEGEVLVDQKPLHSYPIQQRAQKIAFLPQKRNSSDISVERMVLHGRFPYLSYPRRYRKIDIEIAQQAMQKVGVDSLLKKYPYECSGGQKQRVAIARALINNPKIIIADEPTGNLDSVNSHEVLKLFKQLNEEGVTIIMVSHDAMIASYSSKLVYIKDGNIEVELEKGSLSWDDYFHKIVNINAQEIKAGIHD